MKRKQLDKNDPLALNHKNKKQMTNITEQVGGTPHPTIKGLCEASPAIKCKGCGKRINECNESMFGTFALEQSKNYVNRKGVASSYDGIEDTFLEAYNTSFRFYMWWKERINIDEMEDIDPTPCVWNSSFSKAVDYLTEQLNKNAKSMIVGKVIKKDDNLAGE